jgi:uncharacterized membrane protein (UPF0127 family)
MAKLINQTKSTPLAENVETAQSLWTRTRGLLGRSSLESGKVLWISPCSSIHTCFMRFPIDVAFVDKHLKVTRVKTQIGPWKLVFSPWKSKSVFEFPAGTLTLENIQIGDQLHVDR